MKLRRRSAGLNTAAFSLLTFSLVACADDPAGIQEHGLSDDHHASYERLLIADGAAPLVHLVDADSHQTLATYEIAAPARVYRGAFGRWGYAVQGEQNRVQIVDSGISVQDHGDHAHVERLAPGLLPFMLEGQRPVHFVPHGAHAAAFFDDSGSAFILDEASLLRPERSFVALDTGIPHHGVALAFGDQFLATTAELLPGAERASLTGLAAYDAKGVATGESFGPCPGLHGEASLAHVAAFGCSDGVLVLEQATQLSARKIAYPSSALEQPPRVGTIVAHAEVAHMVGNFGPDQLCLIDLVAGSITPIAVPAPYIQFAFDAQGTRVLLLDKTGTLHILDASDLTPIAALAVTSAPSDDSGHGARYPQFAIGTQHLFVTDPQQGKVVVVDLASQSIAHEIEVAGNPTKIALLGGLPD